MKRRRKYFDSEGNETTADKGATCQELVMDDKGQVVSETLYENRKRPTFARFDKQAMRDLFQDRPELTQ